VTTLQRLIDYPHAAVFDKAPGQVLAFRLRHPDGARWSVADAVFTAWAGAQSWEFDLAALTVAGLAAALEAVGFEVDGLAPEIGRLSALVLVEGVGDEGVSNGDRIGAYTSLLWVLMGGYAVVLREAGAQVVQALRQMVITQAEGEWLDLWGALYDVARRAGEGDGAYAPRIPQEAFRLRESPIAIEEAVRDATGKAIHIEEPWENIFRLDTSLLSGGDKFQDGQRVGYFYIQPVSDKPLDWSDVLPVIERNKAAGVIVLPPFARNRSYVTGPEPVVYGGARRSHLIEQRYEDRVLLDYSAIEDVAVLNYPSLHRQAVRHAGYAAVTGWPEAPWPPVPWNDAPYLVIGYHFRSYREYRALTVYESQYWQDAQWPDVAWQDYNVVIGSLRYRVSADDLNTFVNVTLPADGYL
jgi:hypothetical protein